MNTIRHKIYHSYANVAMAHAALQNEKAIEKYQPVHYAIRARLLKGLSDGSMKIGTMWDEEKKKN